MAYDGASKVLKQSIADIPDFDTSKYNLINCNGCIYRYDKMPDGKAADKPCFPY
jgi:hypothetical protein